MVKEIKTFLGFLLCVSTIAVYGQQDNIVLRIHFAGVDKLTADKEATNINKIFSLEESAVFKAAVFKKVSEQVGAIFKNVTAEQFNLFNPILDDLYKSEWCLIIYRQKDTMSEVVLGVSIPADKATIWNDNFVNLAEISGGRKPSNKRFGSANGWEGKINGSFNLLRFARAGDWTVLGLATNKFNAFEDIVKKIQKKNFPQSFNSNNWLEAEVNLDWFTKAIKMPMTGGADFASVRIYNRGGEMKTAVALHYPAGIKWNYQPLNPPIGLIYDPIVSFTAISGSSSLLNEISIIKQLKLKSVPDQLYLWGQGLTPFSTYFAVPVPDATNLMNELAIKLPPLIINSNSISTAGNVFWVSNRAELVWRGLPLMTPFLKTASDTNGQYIYGGLFPPPAKEKSPAPPELFKQILNRTNLMYYDWEYTGDRVLQWMQIYQILFLFTSVEQVPESKPGQKWLMKIANDLGEAATEIVVKNPREILILRRSTIGLTGFELLQLTRSVDLPDAKSNMKSDSKIKKK